jgi:hypothetical protein
MSEGGLFATWRCLNCGARGFGDGKEHFKVPFMLCQRPGRFVTGMQKAGNDSPRNALRWGEREVEPEDERTS